jgi:hypothetical protein
MAATGKAEAVRLLTVQKDAAHEEVRHLREQLDAGGLLRPTASLIIATEAKETAYAHAVDIVEQVAF